MSGSTEAKRLRYMTSAVLLSLQLAACGGNTPGIVTPTTADLFPKQTITGEKDPIAGKRGGIEEPEVHSVVERYTYKRIDGKEIPMTLTTQSFPPEKALQTGNILVSNNSASSVRLVVPQFYDAARECGVEGANYSYELRITDDNIIDPKTNTLLASISDINYSQRKITGTVSLSTIRATAIAYLRQRRMNTDDEVLINSLIVAHASRDIFFRFCRDNEVMNGDEQMSENQRVLIGQQYFDIATAQGNLVFNGKEPPLILVR